MAPSAPLEPSSEPPSEPPAARETSTAGFAAGGGPPTDGALEAERARNLFLAVLSHELRNPLAAVCHAAALLERRGAAHPELREPVEVIVRQSQHMQRLLDDLLDAARVTHGKIRLREEALDLRAVAEEAVTQSRAALDHRRHALEVTFDDAPLWIKGDRSRMLQVLDDLLANAIKYTPDGGHVALRVERAGELARVTVTDDGVGIDPDVRPRIFEMFVQADASLHRSEGGMGLGLALVRHLVALHGGRVEVHSDGPERGATFVIELPLVPAPPAAATTAAAPLAHAPEASEPVTLVVVEDRAEIRETMAELLRDDGFVVLTADNGNDGLALVERERPHAALLDIGLPGLDGLEVARRLRGAPATAAIRLLALTGYGTDEDRAKIEQAGFDAHLVKPYHVDDVLAALERLGVVAPHRLP